MINKKEYIALLNNCSVLNFIKYDEEILDMFDELRKLYLKYCKEAFYHYNYPKLDLDKNVAPFLINVLIFCKECRITCEYEKLNKHTHEHGEYCIFEYKGIDITGIIDLNPGMKDFKYN